MKTATKDPEELGETSTPAIEKELDGAADRFYQSVGWDRPVVDFMQVGGELVDEEADEGDA